MKILERTTTGLSIAIMVVCCTAYLLFGALGTGWKALAIPTGSMRPDMPPGTLVFVHNVPASSLKVGDVITYINPLNPKTTLTHRIIKTYLLDNRVPAYVTKGDANSTTDVPITIGSVKGRVVWKIPHLGYWLIDAQKPIVILPIIYVASLLIFIEEIGRLSDYYRFRQPYRLPSFTGWDKKQPNILHRKLGYVSSFIVAFVVISAAAAPTALALLRSNVVALKNNSITVASAANQCSGNTTNNTSINVTNNSSQSSSSGSATSSGSGSAKSGNAGNSSSTSFGISVSNC